MAETRGSRLRWIVASAFIVIPLLAGTLFFFLEAPGRNPGVYLEVQPSGSNLMYEIPGYPSRAPTSSSDAAAHALVAESGPVSFFIVGPPV